MKKILWLGIIPFLSTACTLENNPRSIDNLEDREVQNGRVAMPLTAISKSGEVYRLQLPSILLVGGDQSIELNLEDEEEFDVSLQEGDWMMHLADEWSLERLEEEEYIPVAAELSSELPIAFAIEGGETTIVTLQFRVLEGDDSEEITFEYGDLEIEVVVDDGEATSTDTDCDDGAHLYSQESEYMSAINTDEVVVEDFEFYSDGEEVPPRYGVAIDGSRFAQHELVTFESWGASDQEIPPESGEPFLGQSIPYVVSLGGTGDASIRSSAGGGNFSGFDAVQANFSEPVRAMAVELDANVMGYSLELYRDGEVEPSETLEVSPEDGLFVGVVIPADEEPMTALRIVPNEDLDQNHLTNIWGMYQVSFVLD